jgi:hypothetical protein
MLSRILRGDPRPRSGAVGPAYARRCRRARSREDPRSAWDQFDRGGAGRGAGDPVEGVGAVAPGLAAVDGVELIVDVGGGVDERDVTVDAAGLDVAPVARPGARVPRYQAEVGPFTDLT